MITIEMNSELLKTTVTPGHVNVFNIQAGSITAFSAIASVSQKTGSSDRHLVRTTVFIRYHTQSNVIGAIIKVEVFNGHQWSELITYNASGASIEKANYRNSDSSLDTNRWIARIGGVIYGEEEPEILEFIGQASRHKPLYTPAVLSRVK